MKDTGFKCLHENRGFRIESRRDDSQLHLSKLVVGAPAFMRGSSALKPSGSRRTILLRL
jgi:hypothetical protein